MRTTLRRNIWAVGVAAALAAVGAIGLPPCVRSTVAAQLALAMGRRPDWMRAGYAGTEGRLEARLERLLKVAPDNAVLQVGAGMLPPAVPKDWQPGDVPPNLRNSEVRQLEARLNVLSRRFPGVAAVRAHQLRLLTRKELQIRRAELDDARGSRAGPAAGIRVRPPAPMALRRLAVAAQAGQQLEPENGFYDAMLSVGAFAAGRDREALRHLHVAAVRPYLDDHAVEEVGAEWKLLQAAYGNHGTIQKAPAAMYLLLPHLTQMRTTAWMAVLLAAQRERAGDHAEGRAIRGDVMRLGLRVAAGSPLLMGKEVGLDIFQSGARPAVPDPALSAWLSARPEVARRVRRDRYAAVLIADGQAAEADWVRAAGEWADGMYARVKRASAIEDSLALFPPERLLGWWVFGLVLLRQIATLLALWGAAALLALLCDPERADRSRLDSEAWIGISFALVMTSILLAAPVGSILLLWISLGGGLALVGLLALAQYAGQRGSTPEWRPVTVAATSLLPSTLGLCMVRYGLLRDRTFLTRVFGIMPYAEAFGPFASALPALTLLPATLLPFLVLCRVAMLRLPLRTGWVIGVRQTAPYAIGLLALVYASALIPAVAADHAAESQLSLMLTDQSRALQTMR